MPAPRPDARSARDPTPPETELSDVEREAAGVEPEPSEVESGLDEAEDPETTGGIPAASLASRAGAGVRSARRRTDREIWKLAWPAILSQAMASAVALVDIAMIGRLGTQALAAAGYTTQYLFLSQSVLFAIGAACVALMGRAIGAGQPDRARASLAAALLLAVGASVLFSGLLVAFPRPLLAILDAKPGVIELAAPYFRLTIGSSALLAVALTYESAFRAAKDTRTPLWITGAVMVVKVVLNALLIFGLLGLPRLDLVGAGIATLVSQLVALWLFLAVSRRSRQARVLRLRRRDFHRARAILPEALRISFPAVAERAVLNCAVMTYFALLGQYGEAAVAAYTVGVRVLAFSWIPPSAFSVAASTLVAQALGAGEPRQAARAGWRATRFAVLVSLVLGLAYALAREPLARFFTTDSQVVLAMSPFMLILALAQPVMGAHFTLAGALRGAGDTVTPLLSAALGNWALRVPMAFVCARVLEVDLIWVWSALIFDHLSRALWVTWAFRRGRWQRRLG